MQFEVTRTSVHDEKPCEEAESKEFDGWERWCVTLATLEELIAFGQKHGLLVLYPRPNDCLPGIEIYDDYRE